jgi:hypothetical protein
MTATYTGYHFVGAYGRERYGSRRIIEAGKTYRVKGPPVLCEHGLHASKRLDDALYYAPPDARYVCLVNLGGSILLDSDKAVATERTVLKMVDVETILHEFACWCAERALKAERKAGREPHPDSWNAIRVKRRWLKGKATDQELGDAARAAARAAAGAAWAAAGAARAAARAAQNRKLTAMVRAAMKVAT